MSLADIGLLYSVAHFDTTTHKGYIQWYSIDLKNPGKVSKEENINTVYVDTLIKKNVSGKESKLEVFPAKSVG